MEAFAPLARFRESETQKRPAGPFVPSSRISLGKILVFDQSITATGWVLLHSDGGLRVVDAGSFLLPSADYPSGHEGTLLRGAEVYRRAAEIMSRYRGLFVGVVHEAPPVGGRMARPESSLVSALAIRVAADRAEVPVSVVQNQHSKKVLTGSATADKKAWHKALGFYPVVGKHLVTNEGQRDALCLGITLLIDLCGQEKK